MFNALALFEQDLDQLGVSDFAHWLWRHYVDFEYDPTLFWYDQEHEFHDVLVALWPKLSASARQVVHLGLRMVLMRIQRKEPNAERSAITFDSIYPLSVMAFATDERQSAHSIYDVIAKFNLIPKNDVEIVWLRTILDGLLRWFRADLHGAGAAMIERLIEENRSMRSLALWCRNCLEDSSLRRLLRPIHDKLLYFALIDVYFPLGERVSVSLSPFNPREEEARGLVQIVIEEFGTSPEYQGLQVYEYKKSGRKGHYDLEALLHDLPLFSRVLSINCMTPSGVMSILTRVALEPALRTADMMNRYARAQEQYFFGDTEALARSRSWLSNHTRGLHDNSGRTLNGSQKITCEELVDTQFS